MRRTKIILALTAVLAVCLSAVASGAGSPTGNRVKITGGNTQVTFSSSAVSALTGAGITVTPLAPATASGATFTFPVRGGWVNTKNLHALVRHEGGLELSADHGKATIRDLVIRSNGKSGVLTADVRARARRCHVRKHVTRCVTVVRHGDVRVARITDITVSGNTASGNLVLTEASADLINRLARKRVVSAGETVGTGTTTVTLGSTTTTTTTTT